jgi:hypothetical protein
VACPAFLGEDGGAPAVIPELRAEDGTPRDLLDGAVVDLVRPPQGGHVIFVGARGTGLCGDNATLRGSLRFADDTLIALEGRSLDFAPIDGMPDWGRPDYTNIAGLANVPVCPNNTGRALLMTPLLLQAEVEDRSGRHAIGGAQVMVACTQADAACRALCECECAKDYDISVGCDLPQGTVCELPSQ